MAVFTIKMSWTKADNVRTLLQGAYKMFSYQGIEPPIRNQLIWGRFESVGGSKYEVLEHLPAALVKTGTKWLVIEIDGTNRQVKPIGVALFQCEVVCSTPDLEIFCR